MTNDKSNPRSLQIDAAIAEYMEAMEQGSPLDREAFLARHPEIVAELREFIADYSALKQAAPQPGSGNGSEQTTDFSASSGQRSSNTNGAVLDVLRYFGDYELVEEIARGGMGVVYKARQATLNRTVAVKMILAGQLASQADMDRFYAEAESVATLDHPNIVPIFEVGQHQGQHYFSMGYVDGCSLSARISAGPLPPREAVELLLLVCRAVQYAHEHGVVHRDLKPANILLDRHGHPRVTDFGLAKRTGADRSLTTSGQILGTPSYMPPEQAAGQVDAIGPTSDVYSLGAILYAMLTGRPPFQSASSIDTLRQVMEGEPPAPRQLNPDIPRDLQTIALKCLEKSIPRRYATAEQLGDELVRFLEGRPISARPVSSAERLVRWGRRNPVLSATLMTAISLLVVVLVGGPFLLWRVNAARKLAIDNLGRATVAEAQAVDNLGRAKVSEADSKQKLADSYLEQAQALSASRRPGQRFKALDAICKSQDITGPTRDLANAAVAALCRPDMVVSRQWPGNPKGSHTMAFDPELEKYARANNETVSVRNVKDDREIGKIAINDVESSNGLVFSPDGRYLHVHRKSASPQSLLYRIDADGIHRLLAEDHDSFAFSPDSQSLAAWYPDHTLRILGLPECRESKRFDLAGSEIDFMRWNPRYNRLLVRFSNRFWTVFNLDTAALGPTVPVPLFGMAWHPDGQRMAAPSNVNGMIQIYDTQRMQPASGAMTTQGAGGVLTWFSRRGDLLISNDWSETRRMWDPDGGSELISTPAIDVVSGFVFGPDDRHLAASTLGDMVQIWQLAAGSEERIVLGRSGDFETDYYKYEVVISPDGRWIAAGTQRGIAIVDTQHACEIKFLRTGQPTIPVGIDDRGRLRVVVYGKLCSLPTVWKADTNELVIGALEPLSPVGYPSGGDQSPDGNVVALSREKNVFILNPAVESGTVETPPGPFDIRSVAVSPDGKLVASGCHWAAGNGLANVCVWNSETGKLVQSLPGGELCAVRFSPRGKWLAARSVIDNACQLWHVGSWEAGPRFDTSLSAAFSADDSLLAVSSEVGQVQLIETATGRSFATIASRELTRLEPKCFSPDGRQLVALATESGSLHIWNLAEIRAELGELGLDQGWPQMPVPKNIDQLPPRISVERQSQSAPMNSEVYREVLADLTSQAAISPYSSHVHLQLGSEFARRRQWAAAEKSFHQADTLEFPSGLCSQGLVQIAGGGEERYRQLCQIAVSRCATVNDSPTINEVVRLCTLAPHAQDDWSAVTKLLQRATKSAVEDSQRRQVVILAAIIEGRKGNHADAIQLLDRVLGKESILPQMQRGQILLYKAIAQAAENRSEEVRATLASADELCHNELMKSPDFDLGVNWFDVLQYQCLRKELSEYFAKEQAKAKSEQVP